MVKSNFRWLAFVPILITAAITSGLVGLVYISFDPAVASVLPIFLIAIFIAIFVLLWLIRGEARTKIIVAELNFDNMVIRRYYGLSAPVTFYYRDLSGFTISILPASNTAYEYLYIKLGDKNVGKLSEFYHRNYAELKTELRSRIKDLGYVDFSYNKEFKEIFI